MTNEQNIESKVNSDKSNSERKDSLAPLFVGPVIAGILGVYFGHKIPSQSPNDASLIYWSVLATAGLLAGTVGFMAGGICDIYQIAFDKNGYRNNKDDVKEIDGGK